VPRCATRRLSLRHVCYCVLVLVLVLVASHECLRGGGAQGEVERSIRKTMAEEGRRQEAEKQRLANEAEGSARRAAAADAEVASLREQVRVGGRHSGVQCSKRAAQACSERSCSPPAACSEPQAGAVLQRPRYSLALGGACAVLS
jgi:hypothetical protein